MLQSQQMLAQSTRLASHRRCESSSTRRRGIDFHFAVPTQRRLLCLVKKRTKPGGLKDAPVERSRNKDLEKLTKSVSSIDPVEKQIRHCWQALPIKSSMKRATTLFKTCSTRSSTQTTASKDPSGAQQPEATKIWHIEGETKSSLQSSQ